MGLQSSQLLTRRWLSVAVQSGAVRGTVTLLWAAHFLHF
jgi:hypothetical protein